MTRLSVNVNKIATLRNSRGGNNPDLLKVVKDCERFGAEGITVHPRPDERHITKKDTYEISEIVETEYNIEGYPDDRFLKIIEDIRPTQATLVPDGPDVLTSNDGWNVAENKEFLYKVVSKIKDSGVRVSLFMNPDPSQIELVPELKADCIELYTENYAANYHSDREKALAPYLEASKLAVSLGLGINAGHDLDLDNLKYLKDNLPSLEEVSIGHALICDSLYFGLENTIQLYLRELNN